MSRRYFLDDSYPLFRIVADNMSNLLPSISEEIFEETGIDLLSGYGCEGMQVCNSPHAEGVRLSVWIDEKWNQVLFFQISHGLLCSEEKKVIFKDGSILVSELKKTICDALKEAISPIGIDALP